VYVIDALLCCACSLLQWEQRDSASTILLLTCALRLTTRVVIDVHPCLEFHFFGIVGLLSLAVFN
jgi:hypothetical protein